MTSYFKSLPNEVLIKNFEYDDTYKKIFQEQVLLDIWRKSWNRWIFNFDSNKIRFVLNYMYNHYQMINTNCKYIMKNFTSEISVYVTEVYDKYTEVLIFKNHNLIAQYRVFTTVEMHNFDDSNDNEHFLETYSSDDMILFHYFM